MRSCLCGGNWGRRRIIAILFVQPAFNRTDDRGQPQTEAKQIIVE
jgi:hypothetical protein